MFVSDNKKVIIYIQFKPDDIHNDINLNISKIA